MNSIIHYCVKFIMDSINYQIWSVDNKFNNFHLLSNIMIKIISILIAMMERKMTIDTHSINCNGCQ
jgi:hypothetical protein